MPKKIDPTVRERCVQQMLEHVSESAMPTAAAEAIAKRNRVGQETVRRWYLQAQVDSGQRAGATTGELEQIRDLKAGTSPLPPRTGHRLWTSPTSGPGPGFAYVAFVVDVFAPAALTVRTNASPVGRNPQSSGISMSRCSGFHGPLRVS